MPYKKDCLHYREIKTRISDELNLVGNQPDRVYYKPICLKNAFTMSGCPDNCPFYEKREEAQL